LGVALFVQSSFELFQILAECIFPTQFVPASKVVDFSLGDEPMLFENPINLFFFAPHNIPVISINFSPLSTNEALIDTVPEISFKFDSRTE